MRAAKVHHGGHDQHQIESGTSFFNACEAREFHEMCDNSTNIRNYELVVFDDGRELQCLCCVKIRASGSNYFQKSIFPGFPPVFR